MQDTLSSPASAQAESPATQAPFFRVSTRKLVLMSVCTFGLYEFYWFYKNWKVIKDREGIQIYPFARTLVAFYYCYDLFSKICEYPAKGVDNRSIAIGALGLFWFLWGFLIVLPVVHFALPDYFSLLGFLRVVFLIPIQRAAERVNKVVAPQSAENNRLSAIEWGVVVVFGLLHLVNAVGLFLGIE